MLADPSPLPPLGYYGSDITWYGQINKPTRVGKGSAIAIDHISKLHSRLPVQYSHLKNISHFPIDVALRADEPIHQNEKVRNIHKRIYDKKAIESFKQSLRENIWKDLKRCEDLNEAYKTFFETFISVYDNFFPKVNVRIKTKSIHSPWITKGIARSSKRKQKLYEKYLKRRTSESEAAWRSYKNLFESIKRRSKQNYYSENLLRFKYNYKKTWAVWKKLLGKWH